MFSPLVRPSPREGDEILGEIVEGRLICRESGQRFVHPPLGRARPFRSGEGFMNSCTPEAFQSVAGRRAKRTLPDPFLAFRLGVGCCVCCGGLLDFG